VYVRLDQVSLRCVGLECDREILTVNYREKRRDARVVSYGITRLLFA
jgi:hypothetical protein